ncbi:hypothetical protein OSTOST_12801, partial [Ostertagia ostertagi]
MEKNAEVLSDLIKINNDRIRGYEKAAKETADKDADLRAVFNDMASESREYVAELEEELANRDDSPGDDATPYRLDSAMEREYGEFIDMAVHDLDAPL